MSKPKQTHQINVPDELIKELLTDSEIRMIKQRLLIIEFLKEGLSIRAVAQKARVGTDTVVRVSRMLERSEALKKAFQRGDKSPSPTWVFGQSKADE